jgi:pSer/pThr/pTyr-binding forkhead associated (FHA) protein
MSNDKQNHLLIIEDDKGRREVPLDGDAYTIGRDARCDIRLISQFVSRHHATIVRTLDASGAISYRIVDGDASGKPSANGLLINGLKRQVYDLENDDEVVFGPSVRAKYFKLDRASVMTPTPTDEFDITLISPNMAGDYEEMDEDSLDLLDDNIQIPLE